MKARFGADGFATFLEGFARTEPAPGQGEEHEWTPPTVPLAAEARANPSARQLLRTLTASGPKPVAELMPLAALPFAAFAQAVDLLCRAGLATLSGEPGQERLAPTMAGPRSDA